MLKTCDLRQLLLHRAGDLGLDIGAGGSGERHDDVGHGDVDLRLFLARRHQRGEQPQQQARHRQDRRERIGLE